MKYLILIIALLCVVSTQAAVDSCGCIDTLDNTGYLVSTSGTFWAWALVVPDACNIDSISFYAKDGGETGDIVYAGIYDTTAGGDIGALMCKSTDSAVIDGGGAWTRYTLSVSGSVGANERQYIYLWARTITTDLNLAVCADSGTDARREYYTDVNETDTSITRTYYFNNDNWWFQVLMGDGDNYGSDDTLKIGGLFINPAYFLIEMDSLELVGLNDTLDNLVDSVETDTIYLYTKTYVGAPSADVIVRPMLKSHNEGESNWTYSYTSNAWSTVGGRGAGTDYDNSMSWTYDLDDTTASGDLDISIDGHGDSVITGDVSFMWGYIVELDGSPLNKTVTFRSSEYPGTAQDPRRSIKMWYESESGLEDPSVGVTNDTTNYAPYVVLYYHTDDAGWSTDWNSDLDWHDANMDWNDD